MGIDAMLDTKTWSAVPFHFWSVCFFVLGCIVGSFLNVCIHRLPLGMSVVAPPSHCPHCKYSIPWYLNIPLVTWLALRGRCKNCGAPISPRYFLVELITGLAFLGSWLEFGNPAHKYGFMPLALVYAVFLAGLICATFIDFEHFIIPDEITLGGVVAGLIASFALPQLQGVPAHVAGLLWSALGAAVGAGIVYGFSRLGKLLFGRQRLKWAEPAKIVFGETCLHLPDREIPYDEIFYRKTDTIVLKACTVELIDRGYKDATVRLSPTALKIDDEEVSPDNVTHLEAVSAEIVLPREAMGLGDVKFMAAIGAFIGSAGVVFSLFASAMIGLLVYVPLILAQRREWSSRMPYGPYIAMAAVLWVFNFLGARNMFQEFIQMLVHGPLS
ncbi:MAG TPA: prepilin peptidase [Verrucomicrobiae bacterium]|nr:prepilin peptidase [Verrucomicrobiae bacterium]